MSIFHSSLCWNCEKNCRKKDRQRRPGRYVINSGGYSHYVVENCKEFKDLRRGKGESQTFRHNGDLAAGGGRRQDNDRT